MTENAQVARAAVYGRQSGNKTKSIDEQIDEGLAVASENGWAVTGSYRDGRSASRYTAKGRDDWPRVLADIAAGDIDILILWESSRGDRTLTTWSQFLDLCRDRHVTIWITSDERMYDPRKPADWKHLARAGVDSAGESDVISARVTRGQAGAAVAGRPSHGKAPYGYVRVYDPTTGKLTGQVPDPDKAPIVREVFKRLAKGEAISAITRDLRNRKVPTGSGTGRWFPIRVQIMARNRAYLGERVYRGTVTPGVWPALVEAEQFYAVNRILDSPNRSTTRPGRTRHLLSYGPTTTPCGWTVSAIQGRYRCVHDGCVTIDQAAADEVVEDMVIGRLSQPDVYSQLRQQGEEANRAVVDMRNQVATWQARLEEWRTSAAQGETSPATMARMENELTGKIEAAQRAILQADIPPELQAVLVPGQDVRVRWKAAPMAARRRILASLAEVQVGRALVDGKLIPAHKRLADSRWKGDARTWGERWSEADS